MNINERDYDRSEEVIELGVASIETMGAGEPVNEGFGELGGNGISE